MTVVTCVYCGQTYPDGTPTWRAEALTKHIATCEKHPMRKLSEDNKTLRAALVGIVGSDDVTELRGMASALAAHLPMLPREEIATVRASIEGIAALIATHQGDS